MSNLGIRSEPDLQEHRVAIVPQSVAQLTELGWDVVIERGAGDDAGFPDSQYVEAGAAVGDATAIAACEIVLVVSPPSPEFVRGLAKGATLVGFLEPYLNKELMDACVKAGVTAIAVEAIPRTTLAQSMDALSSQTNIAGYAAVLLACQDAPKLMPMMVTAAGTIAPARALILGVGGRPRIRHPSGDRRAGREPWRQVRGRPDGKRRRRGLRGRGGGRHPSPTA